MTKAPTDVVITGIGIVTSQGVGHAAHEALLSGAAEFPRVDAGRFVPYPVHPMPEIDWSEQIPRRGDQRQMENWQRLGVFAAGLALDDAGLKDDAEACSSHGHDRGRRRRRTRPGGRFDDRRGSGDPQRPGDAAQREADDGAAPDAVPRAAVEPPGRQHLDRPQGHRVLPHLHGRGSGRHIGGRDRLPAHPLRPVDARARRRRHECRAPRHHAALRGGRRLCHG